MKRRYRIAAAQYPIDWLGSWDAYAAKIRRWVEDAAGQGAELLVFPEYGAMELASLFPPPVPSDLKAQLGAVASLAHEVAGLHTDLARQHGVFILGASLPYEVHGRFHNRAVLYGSGGGLGHQDKIVMTRFENDQWGVHGADALTLFDTPLGKLGVCICYDVEFPLLARALVEAGAEVILAPSCTETLKGYWRVRVGAQARALENQCITVQSPTVGAAAWSPAVDVNVGAAGVYGPPDNGFPADGVIAKGELDRPTWLVTEIDLDRAAEVRADGLVLNHRDWGEQVRATYQPVAHQPLS
ncbi:MAG: carbon-nitrogen hydrolase family protein [Geminicoccaceae bacterium]